MYFSEAAQQTMLVGVPVISLIPDDMVADFDRHLDYYSSGAVQFVPLGTSPLDSMRSLVFSESSRTQLLNKAFEYTKKVLGKNDGNNTHRFDGKVDSFVH